LDGVRVEWHNDAAVGIVMASGGYPDRFTIGHPITGLDRMDDGVRVFHAGTAPRETPQNTGLRRFYAADLPEPSLDEVLSGNVQTASGRVLTVVATGPDISSARAKAYENAGRIQFNEAHYRRDIGILAEPPPRAATGPRGPAIAEPGATNAVQ
jgi:phosphoribosylamine--glycine ligase